MLHLFSFCSFVLLLTGTFHAQPVRPLPAHDLLPRLRHFTEADYGAQAQNWGITQDRYGILYVANSGGVLRFDGQQWTVHQLPGRPTVRTVHQVEGRLYVGGYGEFGYFRTRKGQLLNYVSLSAKLPAAERTHEIWNIEVLADGTVFFHSFFTIYRYADDELIALQLGNMLFAHAVADTLLVPLNQRGVVAVSRQLVATMPSPGPPGAGDVVELTGPNRNYLLLATSREVFRYDAATGQRTPWSAEANRLLAGQQINRLLTLRDGTLAVGTIRNGLYLFTPKGTLSTHLNFLNGLSNNTVLSLFEDRSGNLWAGLDRGLDLIVRSQPLRYYHQPGQPIGAVYAAASFGDYTYLGTNQGLFYRDTVTASFRLVPGMAGQVWELRPTPQGLLCGNNRGTALVDGTSARWLTQHAGGFQTIPVPHDSRLLLQATYSGITLLDLTGGGAAGATNGETATDLMNMEGVLAPIRYLVQTGPAEVLALHAYRGAYRVRLASDWSRIVAVDTITTPELVRPVLARFGDTLVVQTDEESYRYTGERFELLTTFRGMAIDPGSYLLPGRPGSTVWFGVARDRVTVYRGEEMLAAYPVKARHPAPQIVAQSDGSYLLGLEDGFAVYRIGQPRPANVNLLLDMDTLPSTVRFHYTLPLLDRSVRYRYRLQGFGGIWSDWSEQGVKEFTNLEAGTYGFEVETDWLGTGAIFPFRIPAPWYRTPLAYICYGLLLLGVGYLLYREHLQRLARQARKLEVVRQRELHQQRIAARNEELERDVKRKGQELANSTLALAKKNEMLLELKDELAKLSKQDNIKSPHKLLHLIDRNLNNEKDWAIFESHFNEVHAEFLQQLRETHPDLTAGDLQLAAYLRMDLSSKEIAPLLHISVRGVENKRYRLRKKIDLDSNDNLNQYLQTLSREPMA